MLRAARPVPDQRESFDAYEYLAYLRSRARFVLIVCGAAGLAVLIASLLLAKQYTATATVVIDPPAGNDPRTSITVNPVYFESLRAYELLASSDTLFQQAVEKFHLRDSQTALESLKRRILKVTKVRDTKILEIAVTLPDPKQAQAVAEFLARETVALTRNSNLDNDRDLLRDAQKRADEAQQTLARQQVEWREFSTREPSESIKAEVKALSASRERLGQDLLDSRAEAAEFSSAADDPREGFARARVGSLEKQNAALTREIESKAALQATREARGAEIGQRLQAAQKAFDLAAARVHELESSEGTRGERLRVMDPGVVPERPSAPNIPLNVMLALAVALIASLAYLTLTFRA